MRDDNRVLTNAEWALFAAGLDLLRDFVDALLLPRTENGFVDLGSFQELLFDHDLSRTLSVRLEVPLPKRRPHSRHLFQAFPDLKALAIELQFVRRTLEEEVTLNRLQPHHQDDLLASFVPTPVPDTIGRTPFPFGRISGPSFLRLEKRTSAVSFRAMRCDEVTASDQFWQGSVDLAIKNREKLHKGLEEVHSALNSRKARHSSDLFEGEGGEARRQATMRKLAESIRLFGSVPSDKDLTEWFRAEQLGGIVGLSGFLPAYTITSEDDPKTDYLLLGKWLSSHRRRGGAGGSAVRRGRPAR